MLPLCQSCLKIHRQQIPHPEHASKIIPYKQSKSIALSSITAEISSITQAEEVFQTNFRKFQELFLHLIQACFSKVKGEILEKQYRFLGQKLWLMKRKKCIEDNQIGELIDHYEKGSVFVDRFQGFQWRQEDVEMAAREVENIVKKLCFDLSDLSESKNSKKQGGSTISDCYSQNNGKGACYSQNNGKGAQENKQKNKKGAYNNGVERFRKGVVDFAKTQPIDGTSKKRHGIFVSSSPKSKLVLTPHHPKACSQKNKPQINKSNNLLYQNRSVKSLAIKNSPGMRMRVEKTTKVELAKLLPNDENMVTGKCRIFQQDTNSNGNWKKVVKISTNSVPINCPAATTSIEDNVLNPKEMRELIQRKKLQLSKVPFREVNY